MKPNSKVDCARAPVVALGGQEFFVPPLALRQARIAVPGPAWVKTSFCCDSKFAQS